ncbi:hypothetical protein SCHPADRAFT_910011 [Schizopora paradoxa]|uniref:Uncharacterized protein n=1 Tax=Schizopora paradoxa TaxID=27342 RepID=A0A0H2R4W5_9AGAM|nr:hypothetical protein SCHPADRAFT_910011 [Schizopora paradoxa]
MKHAGKHNTQTISPVLEGALIGAVIGITLAGLIIAIVLWRERRRSKRRRFETDFGPTPFLLRNRPPLAQQNTRRPRASSSRRAEANTMGAVKLLDAKRKSFGHSAERGPREIPRAFTSPPKKAEFDFKSAFREDAQRKKHIPEAHLPIT